MATETTTPDRGRQYRRRSTTGATLGKIGARALLYGALLLLAAIFLVPFYLILRNALMTQAEITSFESWLWWAEDPQWGNFRDVVTDDDMLLGLRNSGVIATTTVVFQLLFASMAGYALARIPAAGRGIVFGILLSTLMIPAAVTFVPTYVVVSWLGGVGEVWGIIVPGLFSVFSVFLFRQFFLEFPAELEEAARLDGAGYFRIYAGIILPNSVGIMVALGALGFIASWNGFLWPLVIATGSESAYTVQVVISQFVTAQVIDLPGLFTATAIGAAPLVILFLILQRYIAQGVRLSGIKG